MYVFVWLLSSNKVSVKEYLKATACRDIHILVRYSGVQVLLAIWMV